MEGQLSDENEPDPPHGDAGGGEGGDPDRPDDFDVGGAAAGQEAGADPRWKAVPDRFWWIPFLVGVAMLAGYAVALSYMMDHVRMKDPYWSRLVYLFSGVEALAFGAAGFFFGREVHRGRADAAENRADAESRRASRSEREAATAGSRLQTLQELADAPPAAARAGIKALDVDALGDDGVQDALIRLDAIARLTRKWSPAARPRAPRPLAHPHPTPREQNR